MFDSLSVLGLSLCWIAVMHSRSLRRIPVSSPRRVFVSVGVIPCDSHGMLKWRASQGARSSSSSRLTVCSCCTYAYFLLVLDCQAMVLNCYAAFLVYEGAGSVFVHVVAGIHWFSCSMFYAFDNSCVSARSAFRESWWFSTKVSILLLFRFCFLAVLFPYV